MAVKDGEFDPHMHSSQKKAVFPQFADLVMEQSVSMLGFELDCGEHDELTWLDAGEKKEIKEFWCLG